MSGDHPTAQALIPTRPTLRSLRTAAADCKACELWRQGTQTVFGEGPSDARVVLVGEQPGDREDREGRPFVGPAGALLDRALGEAGFDRERIFLTNAVKHFRHEPRGKRRIHRKPGLAHIRACVPWMVSEISVVDPEVVVALGATAVRALLGPDARVQRDRGRLFEVEGSAPVVPTVHPSSILRASDDEARRLATAAFVRDLRYVREVLDAG